MTDAEIEAFQQLAGVRDPRLSARFVAEALRDPRSIRRLGVRSEYALHAAVGLNSGKREQVEGVLRKGLAADGLPERSRVEVALAAAALGELTPSSAGTVGQLLARALTQETHDTYRSALVRGLSAVAARMEPGAATETAATLARAMTETADSNALRYLAAGLSAVAARMEPGAAAACLAQAMSKTIDPYELSRLARGLSAVAARMELGAAAVTAATLARAIAMSTDPDELSSLA
jgi:hypothetical protein